MSHSGSRRPKGPINPSGPALYASTLVALVAALNIYVRGEPYVTIALVFIWGGILGVDSVIPRKGGGDE